MGKRTNGFEQIVDDVVYQYVELGKELLSNYIDVDEKEYPLNFWVCIGVTNSKIKTYLDIVILDKLEDLPVRVIADNFCKNRIDLRSVVLGKDICHIGWAAFEKCLALEKVSLSENLLKIEKNAFKGCPKLEKVSIPERCNSIGNNSFDKHVNVFIQDSVQNRKAYKGRKNYIFNYNFEYSNFSFFLSDDGTSLPGERAVSIL